MSEKQREVEVSAADVEAAIEAGLRQMGLTRNDVIVDVIDEGSRGLLGIGSRDAVVRLTALTPPSAEQEGSVLEVKSVGYEAPPEEPATPSVHEIKSATEVAEEREAEDVEEVEAAVEVVKTLLEKMQIEATVTTALSSPDDLTGQQLNVIEIHGEDLGMLIGGRGETLNAFQFLARLMTGHRLHRRVHFIVDVEGYRQRREQALTRMAERQAQKVIQRKRALTLEPMPPHERRVIHMALRTHDDVYTQSVGEGKRRRVRIIPQ